MVIFCAFSTLYNHLRTGWRMIIIRVDFQSLVPPYYHNFIPPTVPGDKKIHVCRGHFEVVFQQYVIGENHGYHASVGSYGHLYGTNGGSKRINESHQLIFHHSLVSNSRRFAHLLCASWKIIFFRFLLNFCTFFDHSWSMWTLIMFTMLIPLLAASYYQWFIPFTVVVDPSCFVSSVGVAAVGIVVFDLEWGLGAGQCLFRWLWYFQSFKRRDQRRVPCCLNVVGHVPLVKGSKQWIKTISEVGPLKWTGFENPPWKK